MAYHALATSIYNEAVAANRLDNAITMRLSLSKNNEKLLETQWDIFLIPYTTDKRIGVYWNESSFEFDNVQNVKDFLMETLLSKITDGQNVEPNRFNQGDTTRSIRARRDILKNGAIVSTSNTYIRPNINELHVASFSINHDIDGVDVEQAFTGELLDEGVENDELYAWNGLGMLVHTLLVGMKVYVLPMLRLFGDA
jgi:hypothetical protein